MKTRRPPALELKSGGFTWNDPRRIAASLLQSARAGRARRRGIDASAMAMRCLYGNRAGRTLSDGRCAVLEATRRERRRQAGRTP